MILRMALQPREIMSGPRPHQCIEHRDVLSGREQVADQVRADEAGTAYDERADTHGVSPNRVSCFSLSPRADVCLTPPPRLVILYLSAGARGLHERFT